MINKTGHCPNPDCGSNWEGEDILQSVAALDVNFHNTTAQNEKLAEAYGWDKDNNKKFSLAPFAKLARGTELVICPVCNWAFDANTNEQYESLSDAKMDIPHSQRQDERDKKGEDIGKEVVPDLIFNTDDTDEDNDNDDDDYEEEDDDD